MRHWQASRDIKPFDPFAQFHLSALRERMARNDWRTSVLQASITDLIGNRPGLCVVVRFVSLDADIATGADFGCWLRLILSAEEQILTLLIAMQVLFICTHHDYAIVQTPAHLYLQA